jgi:hypothetical protein
VRAMDVTLPLRVETLWVTDGLYCPECRENSGVNVGYALILKDEAAVGQTAGCPECGTTL